MLTSDQQTTLADRLHDIGLRDADLAHAVATISFWCPLTVDERQWRACTADARADRAAQHEHFSQMRQHATALRTLLETRRPFAWYPAGDFWDADWWATLDDRLAHIIAAADAELTATTPEKRDRGRPPVAWRDRLIWTVYRLYPDGTATKSRDSHFEQTIERLFQFVDEDVVDIHDVILTALKRPPASTY